MLPYGFSYTTCDFATNKQNGKEIRSITNLQKKPTELSSSLTNFRLLSNGDTTITDWITSQEPIRRRHPINLNNNIKDISQKKICLKSANDTIIYRLSLWYKQWKVEVAYSTMQYDSTLDAPKLLNDIQNSHPISQSCLLKGKKHKMLQS